MLVYTLPPGSYGTEIIFFFCLLLLLQGGKNHHARKNQRPGSLIRISGLVDLLSNLEPKALSLCSITLFINYCYLFTQANTCARFMMLTQEADGENKILQRKR